METTETDVLIVGAGPTGLLLAAQLLRYGVSFVLCDKKEGVTQLSKAMAVHARSLEIYDQIGLAQTAVAQGQVVQKAVLMHGGKASARLNLGDVGGALSPFPFILVFEQSRNEALLYDHLRSAGADVLWQTALESVTQNDSGVTATLTMAGGQSQTVSARALVGCDGASSPTRHLLGLGFEGSTFPKLFYVADVDMEFAGEPASVYAAFGADSFALLFPLPGEKHWRLIGPLPEYEQALRENPEQPLDISFEEGVPKVEALMQCSLGISQVHWFSHYKVHTRHAGSFAQGRCFLAGDAAHVHTPAGGQGMNTGIQDAYNLAWKLAMVLQGRAGETLLDTYNAERLANAKRLLHTTDRMFEFAASDEWQYQFFRDHIMAPLASFALRFQATKEFIFPTMSQIGIEYRAESLSHHQGDTEFKVKAGDRMPYFKEDESNVYDCLQAPKFHLLTFGVPQADTLGTSLANQYAPWLDAHALPLSPRVIELFGTRKPFALLLRPDNYISLLTADFSAAALHTYFKDVVGYRA